MDGLCSFGPWAGGVGRGGADGMDPFICALGSGSHQYQNLYLMERTYP